MRQIRQVILCAALAMGTVGCGEEAPHGAPPPRDLPPAPAPAPVAATATDPPAPPTGTDPTGTHPAAPPTGTDPTGTDPTGTDPTGTDPTGTDPTGTDTTDPEAPIDPEHPEREFRVRPEQERSFEAYACLGRRDHACVERLLGDGRAQTAGELSILIRAQRAQHEDSLACASMRSLFERFPESTEAARYRAIHDQSCPR